MPKFSKPIDRGFNFHCPLEKWILKINIFKKKNKDIIK